MLNVNELSGFGVGGDAAHKYWRIRATSVPYGPFGTIQIEMRATVGGADQCNGGTAIESSHTGVNLPSYAFDNVINITWTANTGNVGEWIGYNFTAPVTVKEIVLLDNIVNTWPVGGVAVDYSDDGINWTQVIVVDPITHLPAPDPLFGSGHSYMLIVLS